MECEHLSDGAFDSNHELTMALPFK